MKMEELFADEVAVNPFRLMDGVMALNVAPVPDPVMSKFALWAEVPFAMTLV
jgi:hypothetical protein